jgi:hypothetical protein
MGHLSLGRFMVGRFVCTPLVQYRVHRVHTVPGPVAIGTF